MGEPHFAIMGGAKHLPCPAKRCMLDGGVRCMHACMSVKRMQEWIFGCMSLHAGDLNEHLTTC